MNDETTQTVFNAGSPEAEMIEGIEALLKQVGAVLPKETTNNVIAVVDEYLSFVREQHGAIVSLEPTIARAAGCLVLARILTTSVNRVLEPLRERKDAAHLVTLFELLSSCTLIDRLVDLATEAGAERAETRLAANKN